MSDAVNRTRYGDALRPPDGDVAPMNQIDFDLTATLDRVSEWQGSDLHLKHGSPPLVRVHGELVPLTDVRQLTPADTERVLWQMLEEPSRVAEFENEHEVDFSYAHTGANPTRFRVNAFRQLGGITLVCRAIPEHIRSVEELSLPPVISELAREERGIVLVTGTTGSGKTTTLAAARLYRPEKRPFWPHITFARVKRGERRAPPVEAQGLPSAPFDAAEVTLYRSHLSPRGARYEALERLRLDG